MYIRILHLGLAIKIQIIEEEGRNQLEKHYNLPQKEDL